MSHIYVLPSGVEVLKIPSGYIVRHDILTGVFLNNDDVKALYLQMRSDEVFDSVTMHPNAESWDNCPCEGCQIYRDQLPSDVGCSHKETYIVYPSQTKRCKDCGTDL